LFASLFADWFEHIYIINTRLMCFVFPIDNEYEVMLHISSLLHTTTTTTTTIFN
jgi:hypothetical protein